MRRRRSLARSCSVHGSTTAPMRKHASIAEHPLGPVADQRHHDVAAAHARAAAARRPGAPSARRPRRSSTRAASRRARARASASRRGSRPSRTSRRSSRRYSPRIERREAHPELGAPDNGRSSHPVHREDRRAEGDHRDGAPVRRRADPAQRRALRPRGLVPGADRRADEGAGAVRGDDPRGVRRDGAGPDDLRDDRRGALARLDLDLGRRSTRTSSAPTC